MYNIKYLLRNVKLSEYCWYSNLTSLILETLLVIKVDLAFLKTQGFYWGGEKIFLKKPNFLNKTFISIMK